MYDYSNLTTSKLIEKIGKSRYWNLPRMLEEVLKRFTPIESNTQIEFTNDVQYEIIPLSRNFMLTLGDDNEEVKLPPVEGNHGKILFLSNAGNSDSNLISNSGDNDIMDGGTQTNLTTIPNGSVLRLICNKKNDDEFIWNVL